MSEENVDFLRQSYLAFNRAVQADDMAAGATWMTDYLDPEVEWRLEENMPDAEIFRGHEGVARLFDRWLEAWDAWDLEPEQFFDAGGGVMVVADRIHGRGKGSGMVVEVPYAHVFKLRGGKIVEIQDYPSKEAALAAAGLSDRSAPISSS